MPKSNKRNNSKFIGFTPTINQVIYLFSPKQYVKYQSPSIFSSVDSGSSDEEVENCINSFVGILDSVCTPLFENPVDNNITNQIETGILFSEECECKKLIFLRDLNNFRNEPNNFNRNEMVKTSVRKFRQEQRKKKIPTPT